MLKKKLFWQAILISILACITVTLFAAWLAREQAKEELQTYLTDVVEQAMLRSSRAFTVSGDILAKLDRLDLKDCSDAHQRQLRDFTFKELFIRDVLYAPNQQVQCSQSSHIVYSLPPRDQQTVLGRSLWFAFKGDLPRPSVLYGSGPHYVVMDSQYLVDILPVKKRELYIEAVLNHRVLAKTKGVKAYDQSWLQQSRVSPTNPNYKMTAYLPPKELQRAWLASFKDLLPLGFIICVLLIGIIAWLTRRSFTLGVEIIEGLQLGEFVVHYQPMVALANGKVCCAEALLRWQRQNGSKISPDIFIAYAEENGQISLLTQFVLEKVITDLSKLSNLDISVSVNLAGADLASPLFVENLAALCKKHHIAPNRIELEITERSLVLGPSAIDTISRLRGAGHLILIDDFGTGYSSLSYLHNLPVDLLKIDKSFVQALGSGAATHHVASHIVQMATALGLSVVAEGIETSDQAEILKEMGVEWGQGWLYAKAMPFDDLCKFLQAPTPTPLKPLSSSPLPDAV
ncbi:EAL domain-containing protein [Iodobacter sp. CM08]|uniref:EAL domain-containing protein n=1 Tax=Iodobacter sp. CM08 TaxID=3085902 RepID=UPI002981A2F7|nr:EAL domain-containing protein [Iodobacter sp. CM08]MDW5418389.1 EAL domain-containing protein [Iodobacter sp. CM08]